MTTNILILGLKSIPSVFANLFSHPVLYAIGTVVGACITFLFGTVVVMYAFAGLLTLDAITGWLKARNNGKQPDSQTLGYKTFAKLIAYMIIIITVALLSLIGCSLPILIPLFTGLQLFVIYWICSREAVSILENLNEGYGDRLPAIKHIYSRIVGLTKKADDSIDDYLHLEKPNENAIDDF